MIASSLFFETESPYVAHKPPASASPVLRLQAWTAMPSSTTPFWTWSMLNLGWTVGGPACQAFSYKEQLWTSGSCDGWLEASSTSPCYRG
jgi:hypothetical protein